MSALVPHVAAMPPPPFAHTLGGLYNHLLGYLSTFLKQEYRPAHFARMAKVCRRFRQFFNDLIEKWKVEAMKVLMARLGEPVSVRELPQAFAQKHGKEFWPQKGFERWLQGHSEDFTIGKIGGHNYVAFKGYEFSPATLERPQDQLIGIEDYEDEDQYSLIREFTPPAIPVKFFPTPKDLKKVAKLPSAPTELLEAPAPQKRPTKFILPAVKRLKPVPLAPPVVKPLIPDFIEDIDSSTSESEEELRKKKRPRGPRSRKRKAQATEKVPSFPASLRRGNAAIIVPDSDDEVITSSPDIGCGDPNSPIGCSDTQERELYMVIHSSTDEESDSTLSPGSDTDRFWPYRPYTDSPVWSPINGDGDPIFPQ